MMAFAEAFATKQQIIHASALHCVLQLKSLTKIVLTCFTKMIAEQPSLTQYERPMCHMKEKINMLSSTNINFMIFLFFILRNLGLNLGFFILTHTAYYERQ